MANPEKLRSEFERCRAACRRISNLRQGFRADGSIPDRGPRRMRPARKARLARAAQAAAYALLNAEEALARAMRSEDAR